MLKNIFLKTLFEKRWVIFLWFGATLASIFAISLIFPPIRDTMGSMMGQVPESMKNWFGSAETWQTYSGFSGHEIYTQMTMLIVVMAIVFGSSFLAGEEASGRLLATMARPVRRSSVYWQRYIALVVIILLVASAYFFGAVLGGWAMGEVMEYDRFLQASLMVFLLALALGTGAYAIGAATGRRMLAGLVVGFYAFLAYFIASLSTATDIVDKLSYGSLFRYVAAPEVMNSGLSGRNVLIFLAISALLLLVALPIFARRDLHTR